MELILYVIIHTYLCIWSQKYRHWIIYIWWQQQSCWSNTLRQYIIWSCHLKSLANQLLVQQYVHTKTKKHQNSTLVALCEENPPWSLDFPCKGPVIWTAFACYDVQDYMINPSDNKNVINLQSISAAIQYNNDWDCTYMIPLPYSIYGSGHKGEAVLLPGFATMWWYMIAKPSNKSHLHDLPYIHINQKLTLPAMEQAVVPENLYVIRMVIA